MNDQDQEQMISLDAAEAEIDPAATPVLHGMRGTATAAVKFDYNVPVQRRHRRRRGLSSRAGFFGWRLAHVRGDRRRAARPGRDDHPAIARPRPATNPHQAARIGQMLIKLQTAAAWVTTAAERSCDADQRRSIGTVNLARIAIEQACLDVIPLAQRSLGLAGFLATIRSSR